MRFGVIVAPDARADLRRPGDHLLQRAGYAEDLNTAEHALEAIASAMLARAGTPIHFCQVAGSRSGLRRALVIPFGASGHVPQHKIT